MILIKYITSMFNLPPTTVLVFVVAVVVVVDIVVGCGVSGSAVFVVADDVAVPEVLVVLPCMGICCPPSPVSLCSLLLLVPVLVLLRENIPPNRWSVRLLLVNDRVNLLLLVPDDDAVVPPAVLFVVVDVLERRTTPVT